MGVIQSILDNFWIKLGKTEKVYPVNVLKHRVQGDKIVFDGMDKGRTLVDDDTGEKTFELLNEPHAEGLLKYQDFMDTTGKGNWARLVMIDRKHFVPLQDSYNTDVETYESKEDIEKFDIEKNALEYTMDVATFKEWADKDFEQSSKIVETETQKWWQTETAKSAILFVSAGLFFIFVGFSLSEIYLAEVSENLQLLTEALNNADLSSISGGN